VTRFGWQNLCFYKISVIEYVCNGKLQLHLPKSKAVVLSMSCS
jgi:hypothetical protein